MKVLLFLLIVLVFPLQAYAQSPSEPDGEQSDYTQAIYITAGVIALIVAIAAIAIYSSRKADPELFKDVKRKDFTLETKEKAKELQEGKCAICEKNPTDWEFYHIHDIDDNSIENCQGLCIDCHQKITSDDDHS